MITFRTEQTVGEATTITEVDVMYSDDDSASAIAANNKMVDVFCDLLLPEGEVIEGELMQTHSNLDQPLPPSLIQPLK